MAILCVAMKKPIACQKGAKPNDERAHGCGMDCLPKIFGPEKFSVATLCVAMKKPTACLKGAKPKDERAHARGRDCLPKILWARKSLGGDSVRCYAAIKPRSLA